MLQPSPAISATAAPSPRSPAAFSSRISAPLRADRQQRQYHRDVEGRHSRQQRRGLRQYQPRRRHHQQRHHLGKADRRQSPSRSVRLFRRHWQQRQNNLEARRAFLSTTSQFSAIAAPAAASPTAVPSRRSRPASKSGRFSPPFREASATAAKSPRPRREEFSSAAVAVFGNTSAGGGITNSGTISAKSSGISSGVSPPSRPESTTAAKSSRPQGAALSSPRSRLSAIAAPTAASPIAAPSRRSRTASFSGRRHLCGRNWQQRQNCLDLEGRHFRQQHRGLRQFQRRRRHHQQRDDLGGGPRHLSPQSYHFCRSRRQQRHDRGARHRNRRFSSACACRRNSATVVGSRRPQEPASPSSEPQSSAIPTVAAASATAARSPRRSASTFPGARSPAPSSTTARSWRPVTAS